MRSPHDYVPSDLQLTGEMTTQPIHATFYYGNCTYTITSTFAKRQRDVDIIKLHQT
jgi:hypothetical protein